MKNSLSVLPVPGGACWVSDLAQSGRDVCLNGKQLVLPVAEEQLYSLFQGGLSGCQIRHSPGEMSV